MLVFGGILVLFNIDQHQIKGWFIAGIALAICGILLRIEQAIIDGHQEEVIDGRKGD